MALVSPVCQALIIGNDLDTVVLPNSHAAVRGAQVLAMVRKPLQISQQKVQSSTEAYIHTRAYPTQTLRHYTLNSAPEKVPAAIPMAVFLAMASGENKESEDWAMQN